MSKVSLIAGRYLIIKHIGKGGMADVYVAVDTVLNREVAIKILKGELSSDPVALERFKREAQASTRLSHPNIVDIYDVGDDGMSHYIVMEYIKGQTLKQLIQKRGPLYYTEAISMMKQLCSAIMESHRNGIIHRDIKSQNVLIKDDGTVKIVDFGIALANNAMQITSQDNVLGSVHYIAPEVAKGETASMQSDIYSLGIVFYELLCGDVPFKGDSAVQVVMQSIKKPIPYVKNFNKKIPQSVENIILKATAKNKLNRYENVADMLKDLNVCLSDKHQNDERIVFDYPEDLNLSEEDIDKKRPKPKKATKKKKKAKSKKTNVMMGIYLGCVTLVTAIIVFVILYLGGIINFGTNMIVVPDIIDHKVLEANEILDAKGLLLDLDDIERVLTEDVEEGLIISTDPEVGSEVERGTVIKITVSDGIYAVMDNYVGRTFEDARDELTSTYDNIRVVGEALVSDQAPGTIISQSIEADTQFDPTKSQTMTFTYSAYVSEIIPMSIIGMDITSAQNTLTEMGIESVAQAISLDELDEYTEDEKADLVANTVVRCDPDVGTSYMQMQDTFVTLYYLAS